MSIIASGKRYASFTTGGTSLVMQVQDSNMPGVSTLTDRQRRPSPLMSFVINRLGVPPARSGMRR